jgi:hypothetical protein
MTSATWVPQWGSAMPTQPPSPLPSLTETYNRLRLENGVEEVLVEGRQKFPLYKKLNTEINSCVAEPILCDVKKGIG